MTRNRRCIYLTEGECEEKLVNALKEQPAMIMPGRVKKFNVIQQELKKSQLMTFAPGSVAVFVFDTDVESTETLKKNISLLTKQCRDVEVLTVAEVLNFEDEIVRATDVNNAKDLTKSKSISEFKTAVNKMRAIEFRRALQRHKLNIELLWAEDPPQAFHFLSQDGGRVKIG